jgi:integrator complex subunit 8
LTISEQIRIKHYLTNLFLRFPAIENEIKESKYFIKNEIEMFKKQNVGEEKIELSSVPINTEWILPDSKLQRIRTGELERKLVACSTAKEVRKLLVELAKFNRSQPLWTVSRNWIIPLEIRVVILNLKREFLKDFSYILMGKVNEMVQKKDYSAAISLITELRNEAKRTDFSNDVIVTKLAKLIEWEKLNIQILMRMDVNWVKPVSKDPLVQKINQMIKTVNNEMPRIEILENSLLMLLNLNDFESCLNFDPKRSLTIELCVSFAKTLIEAQNDIKNKNALPRKREFWDLILPVFNNSNQSSNVNSKKGQHNRRSSDSPARFSTGTINLSVLKQFLEKMRDPYIISAQLSMFAKMHNLLKDDSNYELTIENLHLWPLSISNANGYNIKSVSELLLQLLKLGLKMFPANVSWVRLLGDLEFGNGNNEAAMKYYVQSLIIATEYCSLPIQRPLIDESIIKKMIKCSSNLGCFLQAAVLCQFMEEIDYTLAFKCLQEKTSNFQDAMDSYYSLIWDTTLLEYIIHLHSKKGEHKRRLQAISYIRQLELNANNSEDVKQKAASIRKIKFLRSLANQYL